MGHQGRKALAAVNATRYQLSVLAQDVGELVSLAGGWMCDHTLAGWDISVALCEPHDLRPLQILGVTRLVTHQRLASINDGGANTSIAVTPGVFEKNDHIRGVVLQALEQPAVEVTFWGPSIPVDLHGQLARRQHRLSGAARAFKAHALAAAAVPDAAINATEDFCSAAGHVAPSRGRVGLMPQRGMLRDLQIIPDESW